MQITKDPILFITIALTGAFSLVITKTQGQADKTPNESIAVFARPSPDSIVLRWAPLDLNTWHLGNGEGYRIERYTLARNGVVLSVPELTIVQHAMRPQPEAEWEGLVPHDPYAGIAAQALFGDQFEVDLKQSDAFAIANKVQENEQRFGFALFSADMSPTVARASGLWFTDYDIRNNEKYLYRVVLNASDKSRGSIFISADAPYELPKPLNLSARFNDRFVSLKWERTKLTQYSAYILERSEDGKNFKRISDSPLVTLSPNAGNDTRFEYAVDSLPEPSRVYHYRVRGITLFGETSPPSDAVTGKGTPTVSQVPYISHAMSRDNRSIDLNWDFPKNSEEAIKGFDIERASEPKGTFRPLTAVLLNPERRTFTDIKPNQSNYYKVIAYGKDGESYASHIYYAHLVDSLPPARPTGLHAKVDDQGQITLQWKANNEADIYGYRIYKSYHLSEEPAQLTSAPVSDTLFYDRVDLNTLNEHAYYSVMAIDQSQNHSMLSLILAVSLPDKVRPQPPVTLPPKGDASGISISWRPSGSDDVVEYNVYRRTTPEESWQKLCVVPATDDTVYSYKDQAVRIGVTNIYTVLSIDDVGLESEPATPVVGAIPPTALKKAVNFKNPRIDREENTLTLMWNEPDGVVDAFRIYRSQDNSPMMIYKTLKGHERQFVDVMIPGKKYRYRILTLFANGQQSALSQELEVEY